MGHFSAAVDTRAIGPLASVTPRNSEREQPEEEKLSTKRHEPLGKGQPQTEDGDWRGQEYNGTEVHVHIPGPVLVGAATLLLLVVAARLGRLGDRNNN